MINVFGNNITMEDLSKVEMRRPDRAGAYWQGIPHHELTQTIVDLVKGRGWDIGKTQFALSKDEADLAGAMELSVPGIKVPGIGLGLGFITSNMMRKSLKIVVGGRVVVCHNGLVTGEILLKTKHTNRLDLTNKMDKALDTYEQKAGNIQKTVDGWKRFNLTESDTDNILMEAGRKLIVPWSRIGKIDKEFRNPSYDYETEEGNTSWDLLNAFTHVIKQSPPLHQMEQINRFRQILPSNN